MKLFFTASSSTLAQTAFAEFTKHYGQTLMQDADIVVALGGDGHVLHTLHEAMTAQKPVFAIRRTESVGFLCNEHKKDDLPQRINAAHKIVLHPLRLEAITEDGKTHHAFAINEISLLRETPQAAKLKVSIDGTERLNPFSGDGILVSTPAGSTAYNHSCGGPIIPLDGNVLVMTAICGYRPRGWSYAVLPQTAISTIDVLEKDKRPIRIEAGASVIRAVTHAKIWLDKGKNVSLLFDPDQHLGERIVREQFML